MLLLWVRTAVNSTLCACAGHWWPSGTWGGSGQELPEAESDEWPLRRAREVMGWD